MRKLVFSFATACLLLLSLGALPASAASISLKGLSISPAIEQFNLAPSQKQLSYKINIDNNQPYPVRVLISSLDFKSLNDSGGLAFIGSSGSQLEHRYGLANWLSLPGHVDLPAGGGKTVKVTIDNRQDLSPGGHYAAILFKLAGSPGPGTNKVLIDQVISSLLFVSKSGNGERYAVSLSKVSFNAGWFGWPSEAKLYFANSGNVQTAPRGTLLLRGSQQIINQDSNLVLPGSQRVYTTPLEASKPFWPWVYHAQIAFRADGVNTYQSATISLLYINPWFLLIPLALLIWLLAAKPRLRRWLWRRMVRLIRFIRRLVRVGRLFFSVYLPYRYRKYKKTKAATAAKRVKRSNPQKPGPKK